MEPHRAGFCAEILGLRAAGQLKGPSPEWVSRHQSQRTTRAICVWMWVLLGGQVECPEVMGWRRKQGGLITTLATLSIRRRRIIIWGWG